MSLPRTVTWGLFEDRHSAARFYFVSTHLPHRRQGCGSAAEVRRSAALPPQATAGKGAGIVAGEFNAPGGRDVYNLLKGKEILELR